MGTFITIIVIWLIIGFWINGYSKHKQPRQEMTDEERRKSNEYIKGLGLDIDP